MSIKQELFHKGHARLVAFCDLNNLGMPAINVIPAVSWRFPQTCAYYRANTINICLEKCASPGTAGRQWSWPGYVIDRTPYGVVCHELGHHVDMLYSTRASQDRYHGDFSAKLKLATKEAAITGYTPDDGEWFAEIFRLFVTNPDLLRRIRPKVHAELCERLKPIDAPWDQVLADAPQRTLGMAVRKMVT